MKLLAIIPAYNEQDCIVSTIESLKDSDFQGDYLIVNDGSQDNTEQICREHGYNFVSLPTNCGLSAAVQTGMKYAWRNGYDAAVQFDADGQHLPHFIQQMSQAMESTHADIVIGSRYLNGNKPKGARGMGSRMISGLIRMTTKTEIKDPTSGLRLYDRKMIKIFAKGFDITPEPDTLALLIRKGAKVQEIPVEMQERQGGESYFDLPNIISYMSRTCLSLVLFQWFR